MRLSSLINEEWTSLSRLTHPTTQSLRMPLYSLLVLSFEQSTRLIKLSARTFIPKVDLRSYGWPVGMDGMAISNDSVDRHGTLDLALSLRLGSGTGAKPPYGCGRDDTVGLFIHQPGQYLFCLATDAKYDTRSFWDEGNCFKMLVCFFSLHTSCVGKVFIWGKISGTRVIFCRRPHEWNSYLLSPWMYDIQSQWF